jgi:hypothetical protein
VSHAVIALLLFLTSATGTDGLTDAQAQAIVTWVTAVEGHTPGQRDAGAGRIATMTFAQRAELHEGMALFLAVIQGKKSVSRSEGEKRVIELAIRIRTKPGTDAFNAPPFFIRTSRCRTASTTRNPLTTERMSRRPISRRHCCPGGVTSSIRTARSSAT